MFFLLSQKFIGFSWRLDIVFAVVMLAAISVLLRVFSPGIVDKAVSILKDLVGGPGSGRVDQRKG